MQWGELTDEHAGREVSLTFPWGEEVTAHYVSRGEVDGYQANDRDDPTAGQTPTLRHVLDYGGDIGPQTTSLVETWPVELLPATRTARQRGTRP